ncbi:MAG TPA: HipA N-terminal domain-containing protein [Spirochaetota bacterium]|nr:HipA N-terminal domain-containing protein [Spirochaetota bacterium]
MRRAEIYFEAKPAGILTEDENGYSFRYHKNYTEGKNPPVSLTLPLSEDEYRSNVLFPFFDGLIPEGWLLDIAERTWKLNPRDRMGLLLACCSDCIGAVSVRHLKESGDE